MEKTSHNDILGPYHPKISKTISEEVNRLIQAELEKHKLNSREQLHINPFKQFYSKGENTLYTLVSATKTSPH